MKIYIKIGVPRFEEIKNWGDYHYARAMQKALEELGHQAVIHILPEWDLPVDSDSDVTIHLMGLSHYLVKKGPLNVIWIISHPNMALEMNLEKYDLVFSASRSLSLYLARKTKVPVQELLQFADTYNMFPDFQEDKKSEILFVGNSRKVFRQIIQDILPFSHKLQIWGSNWDIFLPAKQICGTYFPYENVRQLYSSCSILLNDHWADMRRWNLVNNRVFDALACKCLVVSDHVDDIPRLFGDSVVMYRNRKELLEKVDFYLSKEEERKNLVENGYRKVVEYHNVRKRMGEMFKKITSPSPSREVSYFQLGSLLRKLFV